MPLYPDISTCSYKRGPLYVRPYGIIIIIDLIEKIQYWKESLVDQTLIVMFILFMVLLI